MPLSLSNDEMDLLRALSAPLDPGRRGDFLQEVARRLETTSAIGPGAVHRIARGVQREFWDPPPDLREGRSVPRNG
jgi:hypothetical protein